MKTIDLDSFVKDLEVMGHFSKTIDVDWVINYLQSNSKEKQEPEVEYFWDVLVKKMKGKVSPAVMPYLSNRYKTNGVLDGNTLIIYTDSDFTKSILSKPKIISCISEIATRFFERDTEIQIIHDGNKV